MSNGEEKVVKIVLLGPSMVGKTCIVTRIKDEGFSPDEKPTVGVSFITKFVTLDDTSIRLQIWDTAGEERFRSVTPMYYQDCNVAFLVYSITDPTSFNEMETWAKELAARLNPLPLIYLIGNKNDLDDERKIKFDDAMELAQKFNGANVEVSAKTGFGIDELIWAVAKKAVETNQVRTINGVEIETKSKKKCC